MATPRNLIRTCSIWRALEVIGDTPTLLVLEASWLGARRFDQFRRSTGLLKALLSDRLKRLVAAGLFEKVLYQDSPQRYEYRRTKKGADLYWTSLMLLRWERSWHPETETQVELRHRPCGKVFDPEPACGSCGELIDATQVEWEEGPGVGMMEPQHVRRRQNRDGLQGPTSLMDKAAELMGDRWSGLILRSIFTGIHRFEDIRRDTAIATNILSDRLDWLIDFGVIRKRQYANSPPRFEYRLTRKGVDYYPALLMVMRWGDAYFAAGEGPPLVLRHTLCSQPLDPQVVCSQCRQPLQAVDVDWGLLEAPPEKVALTHG